MRELSLNSCRVVSVYQTHTVPVCCRCYFLIVFVIIVIVVVLATVRRLLHCCCTWSSQTIATIYHSPDVKNYKQLLNLVWYRMLYQYPYGDRVHQRVNAVKTLLVFKCCCNGFSVDCGFTSLLTDISDLLSPCDICCSAPCHASLHFAAF